MENKIKVVIIEDDVTFLKAMVNFINQQEDMVVVGTASNKNDAVCLGKALEIDLILMDLNLNGNQSDGIFASLEILEFKKIKIIILTGVEDAATIIDSFTAGAMHYILKENYLEIPNIIRLLYKNETPFKVLTNEFSRLKKEELLNDLSRPEKELFYLLEQNYTQKEIEQLLFKTQNTIKTQIKSILKKLGVKNTKEAVKKIESKGLMEKSQVHE